MCERPDKYKNIIPALQPLKQDSEPDMLTEQGKFLSAAHFFGVATSGELAWKVWRLVYTGCPSWRKLGSNQQPPDFKTALTTKLLQPPHVDLVKTQGADLNIPTTHVLFNGLTSDK